MLFVVLHAWLFAFGQLHVFFALYYVLLKYMAGVILRDVLCRDELHAYRDDGRPHR